MSTHFVFHGDHAVWRRHCAVAAHCRVHGWRCWRRGWRRGRRLERARTVLVAVHGGRHLFLRAPRSEEGHVLEGVGSVREASARVVRPFEVDSVSSQLQPVRQRVGLALAGGVAVVGRRRRFRRRWRGRGRVLEVVKVAVARALLVSVRVRALLRLVG